MSQQKSEQEIRAEYEKYAQKSTVDLHTAPVQGSREKPKTFKGKSID